MTLDGLTIMAPDSKIAPTIYLNGYFNEFKNLKESDTEVLEIIWNSIKEFYYQHLPKMLFDVEDFMCWDYVKNRLSVRLINTAINKELLEDLVSIPYLDLSIIFTVILIITDEEIDLENMNSMIREVNRDVLDDVDVLSNHIYAYNRKSHRLEVENLSEESA